MSGEWALLGSRWRPTLSVIGLSFLFYALSRLTFALLLIQCGYITTYYLFGNSHDHTVCIYDHTVYTSYLMDFIYLWPPRSIPSVHPLYTIWQALSCLVGSICIYGFLWLSYFIFNPSLRQYTSACLRASIRCHHGTWMEERFRRHPVEAVRGGSILRALWHC